MKKRFLCVFLAAALTCAEPAVGVLAAEPAGTDEAAATEELAEAPEEEKEEALAEETSEGEEAIAEESAEEAAPEEAVAPEEAAPAAEEELSAEGDKATIQVYGDLPGAFPFGVNSKLTLSVSPNKMYCYSIIRLKDNLEIVKENKIEAGDAVKGYQVAHMDVSLDFSGKLYEIGKYKLVVWEFGTTDTAEFAFDILHSIDPKDGKAKAPEIVAESVVYTGEEVTPKFVVKVNEGSEKEPKLVTLTEGKDYEVTVTSANKKDIGTAMAQVRGMNENGKYTGSVDVEFEIQPHAPKVPVATCQNNTTIRLSWNKISEAEGYIVERREDNGTFMSIAKVEGKDSLIYDDKTGLSTGTEYEYRIRAYAANAIKSGDSVYSAPPAAGTKIILTCAAPKISEATSISTKKIKLVWNKVDGAKAYNVYQVKKNGSLKLIKGGVKKTTYKVGKLKCGTNYQFAVKAYIVGKDGKTKLESAASAVKKAQAKPATPKLVSAKSAGSGKIEVKWKKISDCSGYMLYRKPVGENEDWKCIKTITGASVTGIIDDKAETGVKYAYTVSAYKKVKKKKIQSLMDAKGIRVSAVCEGPAIITEQRRDNKANIFIKNVAGADGYYLYKKAGDGKYAKIATLQVQAGEYTIYGDMAVTVGTTYSYYAQAYTVTDDKTVKGANGAVATLVMKKMTTDTTKKQ